ncbi:metallophosphoesterase family protein [Planctomicrobium sp. SH664]|uniref:metallophosphoesterase family protein n=1 Tax=Planctomicrobium sp. SH664 TaxID=3448125 RepID=UPI003F5AEBB8
MSRLGFRFVHATCLCLDEPLVGTGPLSPEEREIAEDATFRAWDGIVETCIAAQVEFLLLTGNSFNSKVNSLRARVALEKGFEKLAAHDISVFIAAGSLDPLSSWRRGVHLPPNVTLLADEDQEPVAVMRDQRVLASISVLATPFGDPHRIHANGAATASRHQTPFRIGLVAAGTGITFEQGQWQAPASAEAAIRLAIEQQTDYIAIGEGNPATEYFATGLMHDPGCAQALSGQVTGSRGCTVVDVSATGSVTLDAVAIAPVRWERIELTVDRHSNWTDLAEKMALAVMERAADNDEKMWIVNWRINGEGTVYDALAEAGPQQELWTLLQKELTGETEVRRVFRIERATHRQPDPKAPHVQSTGLLQEFQRLLEESQDHLVERVRRELADLDWMKSAEAKVVRETLQHLPGGAISRRARALAAEWLD